MNEESLARDLLRKRLLICAGGSIGVAHLPSMLSHIRAVVPEASIRVVLTARATSIVPAGTFTCLAGGPAVSDWPEGEVTHIDLSRWAEIVLVMPATANLLAKAAYGIADDLVTTCIVASECPIIFVPSMNPAMWNNPLVQDNVRRLRRFGRSVLEPADGVQVATGTVASGALPPLRDLLKALITITSATTESDQTPTDTIQR